MGRSMANLGWARCLDSVADVLRRGAWYPIIQHTDDGHLILEVRRQRVRISRRDVVVRQGAPEHWSVVVRTGVLRPSLGEGHAVATTYAVCPACHYRHGVEDRPGMLVCPECGHEAPVDWSETC